MLRVLVEKSCFSALSQMQRVRVALGFGIHKLLYLSGGIDARCQWTQLAPCDEKTQVWLRDIMVFYVIGLKMSLMEDVDFPNSPRLCKVQQEVQSFYRTSDVQVLLKRPELVAYFLEELISQYSIHTLKTARGDRGEKRERVKIPTLISVLDCASSRSSEFL